MVVPEVVGLKILDSIQGFYTHILNKRYNKQIEEKYNKIRVTKNKIFCTESNPYFNCFFFNIVMTT